MIFEPVIGLEVHAQLLTETKIFCGCSTAFGAAPNRNTCPVCLGLPGALPVLNGKAVELAVRAAIALRCNIPEISIFARKSYFYPDLPKGYQISQYDQPLAESGSLTIQIDHRSRTIRIKRLHLEEDAGKLVHEGIDEGDSSYVDLNRSGVPLIEIVTEPDLCTPVEAYEYLGELKAILQYCKVSLANMEEGNLRCDANISLRPAGTKELGTKVEIKNLNSFRFVQKALEFEIERQTKALNTGSNVIQETRLFNAAKGATEPMRSKEEAHDYRYFPEPDLLPLKIDSKFLEKVKESVPELPSEKRERFQNEYNLGPKETQILTEGSDLADFFEETVRVSGDSKQAANWILRDLLKHWKESGGSLADLPVRPGHIGGLIQLIREGSISANQGKEVFEEMWASGKDPKEIVNARGMAQISGTEEVSRYVDDVIQANPELVQRYRSGEIKLHGVLVGMVMKASKGKANPRLVNQLIKDRLF